MANNFTINKTLERNLPVNVDLNKTEIHITEKGEIYINNRSGELIKCGSVLDNEELLKRFSTDSEGNLLFDGLPISSGSSGGEGGNTHSHLNKNILDRLSDNNGKLEYNGLAIGGNSNQLSNFTPDNYYSFKSTILHDYKIYSAKRSFTSGIEFDVNDWDLVAGDMTRAIYDKNSNGIVDRAEIADLAIYALETNLVQSWRPNTEYNIGQQLIYLNKMYTVINNFTSADIFNSDNLQLMATGNHNELNNIQGGVEDEYYHISEKSHNIISNFSENENILRYKNSYVGDMHRNIYDKNRNGIVDLAENIAGVTVTVDEFNSLSGIKENIQSQINTLANGMMFKGTVPTFNSISSMYPEPQQGYTVVVEADETQLGLRTFYIYSDNTWNYLGLFEYEIRNFSIEPIDLASEVTGILNTNNLDPELIELINGHTHDNKFLLDSYTQSDNDIEDAVVKRHNHPNKRILDTYNQTNTDIADAVVKRHNHENREVIDYLTESADGKLLYKGNLIQGVGGGSGGIYDLSMFTTNDLRDSPNKRYVTDLEKNNLLLLNGVINEQNDIKSNMIKMQDVIPSTASMSNKLIDKNELNNTISNLDISILDLKDVQGNKLLPNSIPIVNSLGDSIIFESNMDIFNNIKCIKDKDNTEFNNISDLIFRDMIGYLNDNNELEIYKNIYSTDLLDMPNVFEDNKLLISDKNTMSYKLISVEELTNSHENFTRKIDISDWIVIDDKYKSIISHNLNSTALIVAVYDIFNSYMSLPYKILNNNEIEIYSDTNQICNIVINCSQGTSSLNSRSSISLSASDFIDDNRIRIDKTYSSDKLENMFRQYYQKNSVYSKIEADSKFASRDNDHRHNNYDLLNGFNEINGKLYFKSKQILSDFNPYIFKKKWDDQIFENLKTLVNVRNIFNDNKMSVIMSSELIVSNNRLRSTVNTDEDNVRLIIIEDNITVLDVLIEPSTTQKYILGINPDTIIMVEGEFTANICINSY